MVGLLYFVIDYTDNNPRRCFMDYRSLFGIGFIIMATGYLFRSLQPANAYPTGPNVSMGSNPIDAFYVSCSQSEPAVLSTNNTVFIITDIFVSDGYSDN